MHVNVPNVPAQVHKVDRMLKWAELEFEAGALAECDAMLRQSFGRFYEQHTATDAGAVSAAAVPEPQTLWDFENNPHAHAPPVNCYKDDVMTGKAHGVRNSFWTSFTGAPPAGHDREL